MIFWTNYPYMNPNTYGTDVRHYTENLFNGKVMHKYVSRFNPSRFPLVRLLETEGPSVVYRC